MVLETLFLKLNPCQNSIQMSMIIGVGAGPAGLVLAGPLFRQFIEIDYKYV